MTPAQRFLEHVLPSEGYKCATVLTKQQQHFNKHFNTVGDLAAFILTQDALSHTAYHACSSFKTNESRKQTNVLGAKALWIDVDAGEGKPYADAEAAYFAIADFCKKTGLPTPTYVGSGYGVHAYWPLVASLDLATWRPLAQGLKALCHRERLAIDPARTADASSILRTPGTHNRKHGACQLVQCGDLTGPYTVEQLGELNGVSVPELRGSTSVPLSILHTLHERSSSLLAAAANLYTDQPTDAHAIADECRQLAAFRGTNGNIPEPLWYAGIGVIKQCAGGEALTHEWSRGHPNYTHAETQGRFDRAIGPTTCAHFQSLNPQGCEGCSHRGRISSPIQLGRHTVPSSVGQKENAVPPTSTAFLCDHTGLWHLSENNDANGVRTLISSAPIRLTAIQTGEITTDSFSLAFDLQLPKERRELILSAKSFFGSSGMSEIHGRGAVIHQPELFRQYVRETMDTWHRENRLQMRYDQFGWKDNEQAFLFGQNLYTSTSVQPIAGSEEIKTRSQYLGPLPKGSLQAWSRAANALFTAGCEAQSIALLSAFAAPLMRFHSSGEGGAIVSLVSDQSGSGKTTAIEAVASVWGRLKGTQLTDDDTRVSKGLTLGVLGNLPCVYDELYNRDPESIRNFVLMFTNGRDKMRGTVDGQLRHSKAEWQTLLVLASNLSIVDVLSSMDGTDAPAFRLLEFNCRLPAGIDGGDELKRTLERNSGHAGDAFLRTLLQPETLSYVKQALPAWTDSIWKRTGFRSEHRFWVRTLASIVAAGVLVRHVGILDFSVQRILDWAIAHLKEQSYQSTITGVRTPTDVLSEFLHAHIGDMLVVPTAFRQGVSVHPIREPRNKLLIRYEIGEGRAYVLDSELRKWLVQHGVSRAGFMSELVERKVINRDHRRITLGAGTDMASGQVTTVEINMKHPIMTGVAVNVEKILELDKKMLG